MFKAIEVDATSHQRTGREFALVADNRQTAVEALLKELGVTAEAAIVDPSRTMVRLGDQLWTLVFVAPTAADESATLRRAGAKHKRVR